MKYIYHQLLPLLCLVFVLAACGSKPKKQQPSKPEVRAAAPVVGYDKEKAAVLRFYKEYFKPHSSRAEERALLDRYFSRPMLEKVVRLSQLTNSNAIIRAQDITAVGRETLKVKELGDHWFMVSYLGDKKDASSIKKIPIKARCINGRCQIIYITPEFNGQQYGDSLIQAASEASMEVDYSSAEAYVESFYKAYAGVYCSLDVDMYTILEKLRLENLTARALYAHKHALAQRAMDIDSNHDWVINNCDFDAMWYESIKVKKLSDYSCQVFYTAGDRTYKLTVTVQKIDDRYVIDHVQV